MNYRKYALAFLTVPTAGLFGCSGSTPDTAPESAQAQAVENAAPAESVPRPSEILRPVVAQKSDPSKPEDLKAGLAIMQPRATRTVDGYSKVEPLPGFRYFMHAALDKTASIEFDTSGLSSVTLSPLIGDFSANKGCVDDANAGVVLFTWTLDGAQPNKVTVDRNFDELIPIDVSDAKSFTVEVDSGNKSIACDWFGLGFVNVLAK